MQVGYKRSITSEHSTYESSKFVEIIVKKFKYKIEEIQTDNRFEFTKDCNIKMTQIGQKHYLKRN